jgi:hypothetical protein
VVKDKDGFHDAGYPVSAVAERLHDVQMSSVPVSSRSRAMREVAASLRRLLPL